MAFGLAGCRPTQPYHFFDDGDLSHYVDRATEIEYPDVEAQRLSEVDQALSPFTLSDDKAFEPWDLTLQEAVRICLANSKVMRSLGGRITSTPQLQPPVGGAPDLILTGNRGGRASSFTTTYDSAIAEAAPQGAQSDPPGVEAALSAFDAQLSSGITWQKNDRPQNVRATGPFGAFFTPTFDQDNSNFFTQLSKITATGGQFSLRHNVLYDQNNNPTRQVASDFGANLEASFNQPLLAGSGVQYNRIAGPDSFGRQIDGVMLARINTDQSLIDFEIGIRNLVADCEMAYWDLYFDYRNLRTMTVGRASALETWKKVHALYETGSRGGDADKEAQAREQFFNFQAQVQTAKANLLRDERRLRYVMGQTVCDGRLIRPADEPTAAHVAFDWNDIHTEGLSRSAELRRTKWQLKRLDLELIAARNRLQPRLDAVGTYRWLGLGDTLLDSQRSPTAGGLAGSNAYQSLTTGDFQEWQLGLQFSVPIGFRNELAGVRYSQLRLARERAILQDQELELSHQLGDAIAAIDYNYNLTQTYINQTAAASDQVKATEVVYKEDLVTIDLLLEAQRKLAFAESAYYRALVDYNRAIVQLHLRKGSLLEYCGVYLEEGPWPDKAQFDALRLAHKRDSSFYLNYGYTRPKVVSRGPYSQHSQDWLAESVEGEREPSDSAATPDETLPLPSPNPADAPADSPADAPADSEEEQPYLEGPPDDSALPETTTDRNIDRRPPGADARASYHGREHYNWGTPGLDADSEAETIEGPDIFPQEDAASSPPDEPSEDLPASESANRQTGIRQVAARQQFGSTSAIHHATHQERTPTNQRDPGASRSSDPTDSVAASRQGTKRQ